MSDNCEHIMSKNILTAFPRSYMVLPMKDMKTHLNAKKKRIWTQKTQKKILVLFRPFDTTKMFSHFLVFFFGFFNPKNRGVKKRGRNGRKSTKIFFCVFWVQILLFFAFKSSETYFNQNGTQFTEFSSIFITFYTTKIFYLFLVTFQCLFLPFFFFGQTQKSRGQKGG